MHTAFPETEAHIAELVRHAEIDEAAFDQPLARCDLAKCRGTCCHDGVYLNSDEAALIRELVEIHRDYFDETLQLTLPKQVIVYGHWELGGNSGPKTATRAEPMAATAEAYPAHFPDTMCAFLMRDGRCGLQMLSVREGYHPWFFKPLTCWIHPISITADGTITLHNRETDPHNFPDYAGFSSQTGCGKIRSCGPPARETLAEELAMLEKLATAS